MILNLNLVADAADLREARVVSQSDPSFAPLPRLPGGDQITCRITLLNADGTVHASSGAAGYVPRLVVALRGHDALLSVASFTVVSAPAGWTCVIDLSGDALLLFIRSVVGQTLSLIFSLTNASGARTTWAALDCPIDDFIAEDSAATVITPNSQEMRADMTDATQHRALATAGHVLPWVIATLEEGWKTWTLRARTIDDPTDEQIATDDPEGDQWRIPADADPVSNNVIWQKTALG